MSFFSLMHDIEAKKYWIALNMVPGVGAVTYRKLLNTFGSPERVFSTSPHLLKSIPGINDKIASNIVNFGFGISFCYVRE